MMTSKNDFPQNHKSKNIKKSFVEKNKVGIMVFTIFILYDFLRSGNLVSILIDIPIALLFGFVVQKIFDYLRKYFSS